MADPLGDHQAPPRPHRAAIDDARLASYVDDLLAGRREACRALILGLLDGGLPLPDLYRDLLEPSLREVGRRWETGEIPVALEHLATALTEELLTHVYPRVLELPRNGRVALVSCAANELHQVGARIVADTLELHGWRSTFLGAGSWAGLGPLEAALRGPPPDLACLSLAMHDHLDSLERSVAAIQRAWPGVPIVAGGRAFEGGDLGLPGRFSGVEVLPSLAALERRVDAWPAGAP